MKGLVISNGTINNYNILESVVTEADFIICADGGMNHLIKLNLLPDLVLGDLDSISEQALRYINDNKITIQKYPAIKDVTDTALAIEYLIEKKFKEITMIGVTGTRQDHTMANIFLLKYLYENGIKGRIVDDNNIIYFTEEYLELEYLKDSFVSIIPITEDGIIVTISGFFYNLNNENIEFGSTHCISNRIVEEKGFIKIHKGKALIFISKD
jgi:thiamine pyrophosphokinase